MPDELFIIKRVKKTCAAYAQKLSVLWPLIGRRSLHDEDVIQDIEILQRRWRKRVEALKDKGWADVTYPGVLQFARNCPPQGVVALGSKAMRPCKLCSICPFCYMQNVAKLFNKIAALLPERGKFRKLGLNLLEVSGCMILRRAEAGKFLSGHLLEWSTVPKKLQRRLRPLGAFRSVTLDPKVVEGQISGYRFTYRILALMSDIWAIPPWLDNGKRKVRLTYVQSKKQLVNVVGRTCRYPVGLLRGDLHMAMISLNARRGKRLVEYTGCLRSSRGEFNDTNE